MTLADFLDASEGFFDADDLLAEVDLYCPCDKKRNGYCAHPNDCHCSSDTREACIKRMFESDDESIIGGVTMKKWLRWSRIRAWLGIHDCSTT